MNCHNKSLIPREKPKPKHTKPSILAPAPWETLGTVVKGGMPSFLIRADCIYWSEVLPTRQLLYTPHSTQTRGPFLRCMLPPQLQKRP